MLVVADDCALSGNDGVTVGRRGLCGTVLAIKVPIGFPKLCFF